MPTAKKDPKKEEKEEKEEAKSVLKTEEMPKEAEKAEEKAPEKTEETSVEPKVETPPVGVSPSAEPVATLSQTPVEDSLASEEPAISVGEPEEEKSSGKKYLFIGLIVVLVLALIGGGIYVSQKAMSKKEASEATSPEPAEPKAASEEEVTPTEEPEVTPAAELDRADLKIQALNGRGVAGAAGGAKDLLEELGYADVVTGNAENYDYEETEISIKEEKEDYLEMLTDDLSEEYTLADETSTLDEDSDYDAIVIVGKE